MRYNALPELGRDIGALLQHVAKGIVVVDATVYRFHGRQDQMRLCGMKVSTRRVHS